MIDQLGLRSKNKKSWMTRKYILVNESLGNHFQLS